MRADTDSDVPAGQAAFFDSSSWTSSNLIQLSNRSHTHKGVTMNRATFKAGGNCFNLAIVGLRFMAIAVLSIPTIALAQPVNCSNAGSWTPGPVQHIEGGTANQPAYHTVWGLVCGGNVYMIRFSNTVSNGTQTVITGDPIGGVAKLGCLTRAIWTPGPVQMKDDSTNPSTIAFHTVWGLTCGNNAYSIRFSNVLAGGPAISVGVLTKNPLP